MDVNAVGKYIRMSSSKARDLARSIQGKSVQEALKVTSFSERKAAFQIGKVLKSAIANAENNAGLSSESLYVRSALIENGPTLKRWWPRARGMASSILKRTSHIKIILTDELTSKK